MNTRNPPWGRRVLSRMKSAQTAWLYIFTYLNDRCFIIIYILPSTFVVVINSSNDNNENN